MPITQRDLDGVVRKRRVRSLHRWFATVQRMVNKPAVKETGPKYADLPRSELRRQSISEGET